MRPYRPAPRTGAPSANRIRERYLHQLGLQRGSSQSYQGPLAPASSQHVVVIGLPSLPEERATTEPTNLHLESHDFSNFENKGGSSQHTEDTEMGESREQDGLMDGESDSGSSTHAKKSCGCHSPTIPTGNELTVPITSLALSYPTALLTPPAQVAACQEGTSTTPNKSVSLSRWFSKPPTVHSDVAKQHVNDQDSVTSTTTSTTAESSYSTMVSRDWAATAADHSVDPAGADGSAMSSSSAIHGVHFQYGRQRLMGNNNIWHCPTSSLTHALNRFNIDSDCDASVASGSVIGGGNSIMTEDESNMCDEDDASVASHASFISAGSTKSHLSTTRARGRKAGKAQRLLDRAAAHERILQIRNDQSQKTRANLVHSQRMSHAQDMPESRSRSSSTSSQNSIPLLHVQHGSTSQSQDISLKPLPQPSPYRGDLSRTPTASNCSDLRKLKGLQAPNSLLYPGLSRSIPSGVHFVCKSGTDMSSTSTSNFLPLSVAPGRPLGFHPQLVSRIPHVPATAATEVTTPDAVAQDSSSSDEAGHRRQTSVDDVLEVVEALSKLKGRSEVSGSIVIPRIR
ncbi:hypothetical protein HJC23_010176 [Cyclotella cryptica]|uniref:Uncharacterized protein n=1 Tax=Cyclotella cryptica TaxID=29204 RepID=A0ABD3PHE5_9STRA|eukprot:CCRYP_014704-RA/>CCRYP_014704-RA protein AED:0.07 eAED:0.07 QI:1000/1/1/1/0/0/3/544/569